MNTTYGTISRNGDRKINEDSIAVEYTDNDSFFVLADGLGGHGKGDIASKTAVTAAIEAFKKADTYGSETLSKAFENAQANVLEAQKKSNANHEMKTTLVALRIFADTAVWGFIGDSRLYHFRNNKVIYRTKDHSVPQMLVEIGEIKEKKIRMHEDRNKLLKVIGTEWETPKYELCEDTVSLQRGDAFLLCSDGFWEYIDEKNMQKTLKKSSSADEWLSFMEESVITGGRSCNMDNYSAIAVLIR